MDRGLELARARGPLDAIAELAEMTFPDDLRPATVILAADTVPTQQIASFANALRAIEPRVRVMGAGTGRSAAGLDGVVPESISAPALGRLVRGIAEPVVASATVPDRTSDTSTSKPTVAAGPLEAMLAGQDVLAAALAELSRVVGSPCTFAPARVAGTNPQPAVPLAGTTVRRGSRVLGTLSAKGVSPAVLEEHAPWLAGWIALSAQQDQLRRAAFTDELTGAWNRRYFTRYLAAALAHARDARNNVSLMVFDVDNFKTYNDRFGHAAGDEILAEMVKLLGSVIRPTDRVCRIGGDEFAVIFHDPEGPRKPGTTAPLGPNSIAQIASRFQKQVCEHRFPRLMDQAPGTLTISAGLATFPWDGATPEQLLERADALALQSKRQGKNVITFGPGAMRVCDIDLA
ncbi:MAG: GGDEF domain-containing protein [Phycisphaerales bacterium]|nr:GGDEF domain-containing protein [Phycisphaerales bacterium]